MRLPERTPVEPAMPQSADDAFDFDLGPRAIARRTAVTFAAQVLLKVRGLIVVPIYAWLLGPAGMGIQGLAVALAGLALPILTIGLHSGLWVQLTYIRDRPLASRAHSTALLGASLTSAAGGVVLGLLLWLAGGVPALAPLQPYALPVAAVLVFSALREVAYVFPQMRQEMTYLARLGLSADYGGAALGVVLVLLGSGVAGALWALALAHSLAALHASLRTVRACGGLPGIDRALLREAVRLGLPSLPMAASQWGLQSVHVFFLAAAYGEIVVGLTSVGYTVASAVLIVTGALNLVFFPTAAAVWNRDRAAFARVLDLCLRWAAVAAVLLAVNAQLLSLWVLPRLLGARFTASAALVPSLSIAYGFTILIQVLQFVAVLVQRRTGAVSLVHVSMCALHVSLCFLLIPGLSLAGAALSTLLSSGAGLVAALGLARLALPDVARGSLARPAALALACLPLAWLVAPVELASLTSVAVRALAVNAVLAGLAVALGAVHASDLRLVRGGLRALRPAASA